MSLIQLLDEAIKLVEKFTLSTETEASGKVLLTGGYLVLFPKYQGISIALNCQFHAIINVYNHPNTIHIICPQWLQKQLIYNISSNYHISAPKHQLKNVFIQNSLQCFLKFLYETDPFQLNIFKTFGIEITLYGDDSFYNNNNKDIQKEKKMGLGSSAALTVSLIKCLFKFFNLNIENNNSITDSCLHNLCQLSHFISQGKIGSGFDIATSLFGSILFRRATLNINKSEFQLQLDKLSSEFQNDIVQQSISIKNVLNCIQMSKLDLIKIPPYICIIMAVPISSFGSKTPKMVAKILNWKNNKKTECEQLWNKLNQANENVITIFNMLCNEYNNIGQIKYIEIMETFCNGEDSNHEIYQQLLKLKSILKYIREYQKKMSELSEVNVVPKIMDDILNKTESIDCVIEGGVPGAGGFDAIYLLCIGQKENVIKKLLSTSLWSTLKMQILNV